MKRSRSCDDDVLQDTADDEVLCNDGVGWIDSIVAALLLLPCCICMPSKHCGLGPHHFVSSASQLDPLAVALLALGQRQPQEDHEGLTSARARPRKQPRDEGEPCLNSKQQA